MALTKQGVRDLSQLGQNSGAPVAHSDAFKDGMIAALAVVAVHDQETTWREIVATQPDLVEYARADDER